MEAGGTCYRGVQAITRFSAFLQTVSINEPGQVDRQVLERYLADLASAMTGKSGRSHRGYIGQLAIFLREIRQHQWDPPLPPTAMILLPWQRIWRTSKFITILPPSCSTFCATVSHIWPGPYFGYMNCSIRDVSVSF